MNHEIEVNETGTTLWVNSAADGSCIGRFSKRFGMDIHRTGTEQMEGKGECLFCTHNPTTEVEWKLFIELMQQHYQINIDSNLIRF